MRQLDFLSAPPRAPRKTEQAAQLSRVVSGIGRLVLTFCRERVGGKAWPLSDLHDYVRAHAAAAPGSPDRILRHLRDCGRISYTAERSTSHYTVHSVREC